MKISPADAALNFLHCILVEHFGCGLAEYVRKMPPFAYLDNEYLSCQIMASEHLSSTLGFT